MSLAQPQPQPTPEPPPSRPTQAPRRILLATDLSPSAAEAERQALTLARDLNAALVVISVIESGGPMAVGRGAARVDQVRSRRESAARSIVDAGGALGVPVELLIWEGEAGESIVEAATAEAADIVVVGSHSRGAVGRFFVGSVSAHVVRHAPCPVLVVREDTPISASDGTDAVHHM